MSVTARCVTIGTAAFLYWLAVFAVTALHYHDTGSYAAWLTTPGRTVGRPFVDLLRSLGAYRLCQPGTLECWLTMIAGAASIGTGVGLAAAGMGKRSRTDCNITR